MTSHSLRPATFLLGLVFLAPFPVQSFGQTPGTGSTPATIEEKLTQAKSVVGDFIDLFDAEIGPGEVDQRRDTFLKKYFGTAGPGIVELGKHKYLVSIGEVELPFEAKPGWNQRRILSLNRAELGARARMVELIESKVDSEQLFELFQGYGGAVKKDFTLMQEAQKKGALSAQRYREAIRSFAMSQVIGAVTIKTLEGMNNGQYKVVRIMLWSPTLRNLALNTFMDADYFLPLEKVTEADLDQIPTKEADLVREIGCKAYFNKKGQRYYVSYGQAEPLARNKDEIPIALEAARDRAELDAKGALARTLAAEVTSVKMTEMAHEVFVGKDDKSDELVGNFYKRMETVAKGIKMKGVTVHKTWTYKHPEWKGVSVGCVVVWTPDTRTLLKDLSLDKRFDVNRPETFSANLVRAYVFNEPIVNPKVKTPGDNDSKDPKKLP